MSKTIFVTGAAGFIGSNISKRLLQMDFNIIGLDNFDPFYPIQFKERNLQELYRFKNFRFIEGDIRDSDLLRSIFQSIHFDSVIHLAAKAGVRPSLDDPNSYAEVNYLGTSNILTTMREAKIRNLVFASSSSVYGNQKQVPFSEADDLRTPISPYAASKLAAEKLCYTFHHLYGMNISALRFFTVYGPGQRPEMAIHKFVRDSFDQTPISMFGDGSSSRDYTYISDIVDGIESALYNLNGFEIYNLGNSYPIKLKSLIDIIGEHTGQQILINQLEQQPGDVETTYADISLAQRKLGYQPIVGIEEGLAKFVSWYERTFLSNAVPL